MPWFKDTLSKPYGNQFYGNSISSLIYTQFFVKSAV
jgi:hypothetical protein